MEQHRWEVAIGELLDQVVADGQEKAFVEWLQAKWHDPNWERNKFYHLQEYMLASLLLELRLVQGASLRTINIADQYVDIARRSLGSLSGRHIVELGPGRNLGAGLVFRYLGAARYSGIELNVGADFNTWSTLYSVECLARIKYGSFLDNFNAVPLNLVPPSSLTDNISLEDQGISLIRVESFEAIDLPDETADFAYSNFTLEHIQRPDLMSSELARLLKPGGITAHFIDIEDHSDFSQPFNYLVYSDNEWDARYGEDGGKPFWTYENRCRASDFRRFFEQAGLEVIEYTPVRSATISDELRMQIAPRFQAYDLDDLQIVWLIIVARKPLR